MHRRSSIRGLAFLSAAIVLSAGREAGAADVVAYSVSKSQLFAQTNSQTPQLDGAAPFLFDATVVANESNSVRSASVTPPGRTALVLTQPEPGIFVWHDEKATKAELDQKYPGGNYSFTLVTASDGTRRPSLQLVDKYPNTPTVTVFDAAQQIFADADFIVKWQPFTGGTANDGIELLITDENDEALYSSPPPFSDGALDGRSTQVTIPAGTLAPGRHYTAYLTFAKLAVLDYSGYFGAIGVSTFEKETKFPMATLPPPRLNNARTSQKLQIQLAATPGRTYDLESTSDFKGWNLLMSTNAAESQVVFEQEMAGTKFYRVRMR